MSGAGTPRAAGDRVKQLRAFCHAARLGSFTRAADYLASNQTSVSQQVRALEREFEVALFERRGPSIRLTRIGRELLDLAFPAIMEVDRLRESFEERYRGSSSAPLVIAATGTCSVKLVPGYLKRFREEHAGIRVELKIGGGTAMIGWLRAYEIELAFGAMDVAPPDVEFHRLLTSRVVLITPAGHALAGSTAPSLDSLAPFRFIAHPPEHYTRAILDKMARHAGVRLDVALELQGWDNVKQMVEIGAGVAIVPEFSLDESDRVERIALDHLFPPRHYGMYRHRGGTLSLAAQRFFDLVEPSSASGG